MIACEGIFVESITFSGQAYGFQLLHGSDGFLFISEYLSYSVRYYGVSVTP